MSVETVSISIGGVRGVGVKYTRVGVSVYVCGWVRLITIMSAL